MRMIVKEKKFKYMQDVLYFLTLYQEDIVSTMYIDGEIVVFYKELIK